MKRLASVAVGLVTLCSVVVPSDASAGRIPVSGALRALRVGAQAYRAYGKQADGSYVLSSAEVQACFSLQGRLQVSSAELEKRHARIQREQQQIETRAKALTAEAARVDRTDGAAVERFNAAYDSLRAAMDANDAAVEAYNEYGAAHDASVTRFNTECAGRSYYVEDVRP